MSKQVGPYDPTPVVCFSHLSIISTLSPEFVPLFIYHANSSLVLGWPGGGTVKAGECVS